MNHPRSRHRRKDLEERPGEGDQLREGQVDALPSRAAVKHPGAMSVKAAAVRGRGSAISRGKVGDLSPHAPAAPAVFCSDRRPVASAMQRRPKQTGERTAGAGRSSRCSSRNQRSQPEPGWRARGRSTATAVAPSESSRGGWEGSARPVQPCGGWGGARWQRQRAAGGEVESSGRCARSDHRAQSSAARSSRRTSHRRPCRLRRRGRQTASGCDLAWTHTQPASSNGHKHVTARLHAH